MPNSEGNPGAGFWLAGARVALLLIAAGTLGLRAEQDKDKDKNKKPEPAKQAPAPQPRAEPKREAAPRPAEANRPAPSAQGRRELQHPNQEPGPSRMENRPEPQRPAPDAGRPSPSALPSRPAPDAGRPSPSAMPSRPAPDAGRPSPSAMPSRPAPEAGHPSPSAMPFQRNEPAPASRPDARPDPRRDVRGETPNPRQAPVSEGRRDAFGAERGRPASPMGDRRGPEREVVRTRGGGEIHRAPGGAIREIRTPGGAVVRHAPSGVRRVELALPGGRIVIANATGRSGYIQRPLMSHGHSFVQRTYIHNGVAHARIYRPWAFGGRQYNIYTPSHYYRPSFYAWAYSPWARPVSYRWGWNVSPWYGYYGGYFTPYETYAGPSYWLTDFVIGATLESAYLAQNASSSEPPVRYGPANGLTPDVKQAIAEEVRRQMEQEQADQEAAAGGEVVAGPPALFSSRGPRVFMVTGDVMGFSGNQECPLADGDVLQLAGTPAPGAEYAQVRVLASRGSGCPRGAMLSVRTQDLQEMQNHLQATIDQGLDKLQSDQGKGGLPVLPPRAQGTVNASFTNDISPDEAALNDLDLAVKDANRAEKDMINQGGEEPAAGGGDATISLGMTPAQVERSMGRPKNTVDLGAKKIYVYPNLKVTFLNGRVSDVQ